MIQYLGVQSLLLLRLERIINRFFLLRGVLRSAQADYNRPNSMRNYETISATRVGYFVTHR